ncbi:MAG: SUF system NifU family Fe-S cluster assembly protein [Deltaproteobacteria bacterium]|nr:SUF system NifU family Fe-S cluster assembly protein [Deltaproteobacteria bacterium]
MDREELMQVILDHYENPRHFGAREDSDVVQKGGNPGCGDIITIYLNLDDDGRIRDISFDGEGCIISQATTSMITDIVEGKTAEEVEKMNPDVITSLIGKDLALTRPRCATLGITTIKQAIREWRKQKTIDKIEKERILANN